MSDCCSQKTSPAMAGGAAQKQGCSDNGSVTEPASNASDSCCSPAASKSSFDWLLWGSAFLVILAYSTHLSGVAGLPQWMQRMTHGVFELMNTMWWGVVLAAVFVGVLGRIPQNLITAVLGKGGSLQGVWRATLAGTVMDLCSHGILMVGMQLYQRGASLGQVMAFLIASPWNSLSLTIILVALIGLPWTLAFIALSLLIAVISGYIFDKLVKQGVLPANPNSSDLPEDYHFWRELQSHWSAITWHPSLLAAILWDGIKGSRMVLRWLLFGVLLATALRSFVHLEDFQNWFGPTTIGLVVTLVMATIIEVCSEGSTPIAADLLTRAHAPGNSFAFMMTGVSTDYTEVMVLKDTTGSWKIALFLPLVTLPQVVIIALILNSF